jgi:uncharacterized membrane protein HdeD (DUF308 family)
MKDNAPYRSINNQWPTLVRGAVALVIGISVATWPGLSVADLIALFGWFVVAHGIFTALLACSTSKNSRRFSILLAEAVADACLGVFALFYPGDDAWTLLLWIPLWAMLIGVLQIVSARRAQQPIKALVAFSGLASLLFGLCVFAWPLSVAPLIACGSLSSGIFLLAIGLTLRRPQARHPEQEHADAVSLPL